MERQTVYVIDLYNKYSSDKVISKYRINGRWWAIKEVPLEWGVPQLSNIEEDNSMDFQLYDNLEDAIEYIHKIKELEGTYL